MIVLSLFDGMSCGRIALERAGIPVTKYFASEIKPCAIKVSKDNYPDICHIGSVLNLTYKNGSLYSNESLIHEGKIDLLIGGSPCQDFSLLKVQGKGLDGDKSKLFYEFLRLKSEINPEHFLLENVRMKKNSKLQLDSYLQVNGVEINSSLVSIQNRPRIYWSNLQFKIPENKNLSFQDYKEIDKGIESTYKLKKTTSRIKMWNNGQGRNNISSCANVTHSDKVYCLTRKQDRSPNSGLVEFEDFCRYLTREELEVAQTVPLGYTKSVSYNQAQDLLGDGWTVDVIAHIFGGLLGKK